MRIDKWLWCVRAYKTRSIATNAVKGGLVKLNDDICKPSRDLKIGEHIHFTKGLIKHSIEVLDFPKQRLPAKEVENYLKDNTPQSEFDKLKAHKEQMLKRDKGSGRPTKKDRRDLEKWGFWE